MNMNKNLYVGGVTRVNVNDAGTVMDFTVAVTRPFKNKEGKYESDFIPCKLMGEKAVSVWKDKIEKGTKVEVEGSYRNNNYKDKDGNQVYSHFIAVDRLFPVSASKNSNSPVDAPAEEAAPASSDGFMPIGSDSGLPWEQ